MSRIFTDFESGIEQSLALMRSDATPEKTMRFYTDLQTSRFLVPSDGSIKRLAAITAQNFEGKYIPAFTSESEYKNGSPVARTLTIAPYSALKNLVIDDLLLGGIVINPFSRQQLVLHRTQIEEIDSVTTGMSARRVSNPGKLNIARIPNYPTGLVEALSAHLNARRSLLFISRWL